MKKLKIEFSVEMAKDIEAFSGLDLNQELESILMRELMVGEINYIIDNLKLLELEERVYKLKNL